MTLQWGKRSVLGRLKPSDQTRSKCQNRPNEKRQIGSFGEDTTTIML